jgi:hypothetical protein
VFEALGKLPIFQSLELALATPHLKHCSSQKTLLRFALSSASWCSVRYFLPSPSPPNAATLFTTDQLAKMLPTATLRFLSPSDAALSRLRVFVCCASQATERCFVLRKQSAEGPLKWQREY